MYSWGRARLNVALLVNHASSAPDWTLSRLSHMSPLPAAVVQDLLSAFDGIDGQYVRARATTVEGQPHVAFALDAGRVDATLAEHVRLLLPIW